MRALPLFGQDLKLGRDATSDDFTTPAHVVDVLHRFAGAEGIGLDPATNPTSLVKARTKIMLPDDGLAIDWRSRGLVWCNPPYSAPEPWVFKGLSTADEVAFLVKQDTATEWGRHLMSRGYVAVFFDQRLKFTLNGQRTVGANFSSMCVYRGPRATRFSSFFAELGTAVPLPALRLGRDS